MTHLRVFVGLTFSAAAGFVVVAQKPVLAEPSTFEVRVVITDRGDAIFDSWDHPSGGTFKVDSIRVAPRKRFLWALVLFKGCRADNSGDCNADVDIMAYDPSGKVYGTMPGAELWQRKPAPAPNFTQLSRSYMGLVIEPNDPIGTYRISVVARDRNAATEAKAEVQFQVGM